MSLPNSYVEILTFTTQNVTLFGDRLFTEIVKFKLGHKYVSLVQDDHCPYTKEKILTETHTEGE